MKPFLLSILVLSGGLLSQDWENSDFFPVLPGMENSFEEARQLDSLSGWEEKIANDFYTISRTWDEIVVHNILEYSNSLHFSDLVHDSETYKTEFLNYFLSLKESIYTEWKEEIFQNILDESISFYNSLQDNQYSSSEIYEAHSDYFQMIDSLALQKEELLHSIEETNLLYENNRNEIERMEYEVRNNIQSTLVAFREELKSNNLYYILNESGNRVQNIGEDSIMRDTLNSSGKKLEDLLIKLETQLAENRSLTDITNEIQNYLFLESIQAAGIEASWENKMNLNYSNLNRNLLQDIPYGVNPEQYNTNSWISPFIQYLSGSSEPLKSLIESSILPDPNLSLNSITKVDLVAHTSAPIAQWNSFPYHPISNVGGSFTKDGDSFKYYINHTILCWGPCILYDVHYREETISFELEFSVIDENAKKNSEIWRSFSLQMESKGDHWKNSLIPTIQTWETKKQNFIELQNNWTQESTQLKNSIELNFQKKLQELSNNPTGFSTNSSFEEIDLNILEAEQKKISTFKIESITSISDSLLNSLEGIRNLSLFTNFNEEISSSKKEIMENLRASYSAEKILSSNTDQNILDKFKDSGICSENHFQQNALECNGYIEQYGTKKYKSVTLDENLNLIFEKDIISGKVATTEWFPTHLNNFKILEKTESFLVSGISNFQITKEKSIDLFSESTLSNFYSDYSAYYKNLNQFDTSTLNSIVSSYNTKLNSLSESNLEVAQSFINDKMSQSSLVMDFVSSILTGGSIKSWIHSTFLTKTAEVLGQQWNLDPQLLIAYFSHIKNKHNLQNRESKITGGFLPKELAVPIAGLITNSIAELRRFFSNIYIESAGIFADDSTKKKWKKDQDLADKKIRMTDYNQAVASMDYQSQYKSSLKGILYDEVSNFVFQNSGLNPNHVSRIFQHLDQKKAQKKKEKEEQNQKIMTAIQVATAILFPPSAGATLATLAAHVGSAVAQAAIASSSGDSRTTFSTFATAMGGSILGSLPIPLSNGSSISNFFGSTTKLGLGVSLSYTPKPSISSLGDLLDGAIHGQTPSGWSGGIHLGAKGFHMGIGSSSEGNTVNIGGGLWENTFFDISGSTSNGNLGITLGQGNKFGTSAGIVLNSVSPSSIFASYNPDEGNFTGLGGSVSISAGGNAQAGIELGKAEALSSTFSSSGGWSNLQANVNYQSELNNMYAEEMNQNSSDTDPLDSNTTVPLLALYGLLGLLGVRRRKENEKISSSEEESVLFVLPTNLDSSVPVPSKDPAKNPDPSLNLLTQLLQLEPQANALSKDLHSPLEQGIRPLKTTLETSLNQIANLSHDEPGRALQHQLLGSLMCNETVLAGILQSLGVTKNDILYKIMSLQTTKQISLVQNGKTVVHDLVLQDTSGEKIFNPKLERVPMADILEVFRLEMKKNYFLDKYDKNMKNLHSNPNSKIEQVQLYGGSNMKIIKVGDHQYGKFENVNIDQFTRKEMETLIGIFDEPTSKKDVRAKKWDRENPETLNLLAKELNIQQGSIEKNSITLNNLNQIQNILNTGGKILSIGDFAFDSNNGEIRKNGHFVEVTQVTEKGITLNNPYGYYDTKTLKWTINKENRAFGQNNFYTWEEAKTMNLRVSSFYKNKVSKNF